MAACIPIWRQTKDPGARGLSHRHAWPRPAAAATPRASFLLRALTLPVRRKLDKQSAAITFRVVGLELLASCEREGRASATLAKTRWLIEFAFAAFGDRPVGQITAPEILLALRHIEARGRYETARRLRSTCGMVFRYAIATGRAERDPSADLRGALTSPKVNHRAAIVDPVGIGALLRAIDGYDGLPIRASVAPCATCLRAAR